MSTPPRAAQERRSRSIADRRSISPSPESAVARHPAMHAAVLRYLKEVARRGSIRRAAEALNVASSAINRQILNLEAALGVRLFDRMPDGMRATPAGEVLLRHVRDTLYDYDRLLGEIDELRGLRSGHVRIASLDSLLVSFLPRVLGAFSLRYPAITFAVHATAPLAVFDAIVAAEADIGLTFVAPTSPAVALRASAPAPIGAVMSASHPLAKLKVLHFSDIGEHRVMLQPEMVSLQHMLDDDYVSFRNQVHPRFISNSIEMMRHIISQGLGLAFFTRLGFLREIASGEMVWVPLASPGLARLQLGLFTPAQRTLAPAASAIAGELAAALGKLETP